MDEFIKQLEDNNWREDDDGCNGDGCSFSRDGDFLRVFPEGFWNLYLSPGDGERSGERGNFDELPN